MSTEVETRGPQLNGAHYRITVAGPTESQGSLWLQIESGSSVQDGNVTASGYLIDVLESISAPDRANFSYELLTPSGQGSMCEPRLDATENGADLYSMRYHLAYLCGESDVVDLPRTDYTTDMYLGMYYVTRERLQRNRFTSPLIPPITTAITMLGTITRLDNIPDNIPDFVEEQQRGTFGPACVYRNTAYADFLSTSFPHIDLVDIPFTRVASEDALRNGICTVIMSPYTAAVSYISFWHQDDDCLIDGWPIGIIGEPLDFGLSQTAIGVRRDLPMDFIDTWNYWLNALMECSPENFDDVCRNESLATLYNENALGTGNECGYQLDPPIINRRAAGIAGGVLGGLLVLVIIVFFAVYRYSLNKQKKRYKKRFVQQIARNIQITSAPGDIPVDKLADQVQHIGDKDGQITKDELMNWLNDVKMTFLSEKDYEALWTAMDIDGNGKVDAIEFFVFMSACGSEFQEVHEEEKNMSKMERLKLAARRLSNIQKLGESGVRRLENQLERQARFGG